MQTLVSSQECWLWQQERHLKYSSFKDGNRNTLASKFRGTKFVVRQLICLKVLVLTKIQSDSIPPFACKVFSRMSSWSSDRVLNILWTFLRKVFTSCEWSFGSLENLNIFLIMQHFLLYINAVLFQILLIKLGWLVDTLTALWLSIDFEIFNKSRSQHCVRQQAFD